MFQLPPEIHQYIQNNSVVNVKIREYDLTVCKDPLSSSISISIPTFNQVQALPAPNSNVNVQNFKIPENVTSMPDPASSQNNLSEQNSQSESSQDIGLNDSMIQSDTSQDQTSEKVFSQDSSLEPSQPKKLRENSKTDYDIDEIKISDISTAGSSLSTDDDDLGMPSFIDASRGKLRRLNHRLKKWEKRREEWREKLKEIAKENTATLKTEEKVIKSEESNESTPDEDDFFEMVGKAIKKHNETILKERESAERKRDLKNLKS